MPKKRKRKKENGLKLISNPGIERHIWLVHAIVVVRVEHKKMRGSFGWRISARIDATTTTTKPCLGCFDTIGLLMHFHEMGLVVSPCECRTELQRILRIDELLWNGHNWGGGWVWKVSNWQSRCCCIDYCSMLHTFESPICPCLHQKIEHTVLDFRLGIEKKKMFMFKTHILITMTKIWSCGRLCHIMWSR